MKPERSADEFVQDIIDAGERAIAYVARMSFEDFATDARTKDAVRMCLSDMGVAAHKALKLDPTLSQDFPEFEGRKAYEMRNILSHAYFGVDVKIVWQTLIVSVPKIVADARVILARRSSLG
jgi:uncharacterized protein with HEPN domain